MNKTHILITLTFILLSGSVIAQKSKKLETEKLAKTFREKYEDEDVVITNKSELIRFGINSSAKTVKVSSEMRETFFSIEDNVRTYTTMNYGDFNTVDKFFILDKKGNKVLDNPYDESSTNLSFFHSDSRVKYYNLFFSEVGTIKKSDKKTSYDDLKYFTSIYFNTRQPVSNGELKFEIPSWLNVDLLEYNFDNYNITKEVVKEKSKTIITYKYKDLNTIKKENNTLGPSYSYPHVLIIGKSFEYKGETQKLFESVADLYKWYHSLTENLNSDNSTINDLVKKITTDSESDEEKIKTIYYWVQDNIRYIAFEDGIAGFKPDEASEVLKKKYGDCKGMANLTKQMLIEAGFDARLTWIGTKRIAYDYSTPSLSVDNHMICTLIKDNDTIFLDGTEKYNSFGEYANRIQGQEALVEDGSKFFNKRVPVAKPDSNKKATKYNFTIENEALNGTHQITLEGEERASFLQRYNTLKNDKKENALENYLSNSDSNISVTNIETSDLTNRDLDITISNNLLIENTINDFDGLTYLTYDTDREFSNYKLKDNRKFDFVLDLKSNIETQTNIKIPEGYKVSYKPDDIQIKNEYYEFTFTFEIEDNIISYHKKIKLIKDIIPTSEFKNWNSTIKQINDIYDDQIILEKI